MVMDEREVDETSERLDRAWQGRGFRSWLVTQDPRKGGSPREELRPAVEFCIEWFPELPGQYDYEAIADLMRRKLRPPRTGPKFDEFDALLVSLSKCEAEWRAEQISKDSLKTAVMTIAHPHGENLSSRMPQADDVCGFRFRAGRRCTNMVVPGSPRCVKHGGTLVDSEVRRAYLLSAYAAIVEATEDAVDVLIDVAKNGRNELARVAAAKEILDRAGLTPTLNINVNVGGKESDAMRVLRDKLDRIQKNLKDSRQVIDVEPAEAEIVDA
ncbi:MAG TPA: hypothetical protein VLE97_08050 [Gaiellaceae bacterium]|nr:hypothetical protein [Gaiellaceae bacterium]